MQLEEGQGLRKRERKQRPEFAMTSEGWRREERKEDMNDKAYLP